MRIDTSYLDLVDATLGYDNAAVLTNVNLSISAGEFVGVVGPNGSGKSTLVKSFVGLADRLQGEFSAFGLDAKSFKQRWRIGYVPQHLTPTGVLPATVEEVVASGRLARGRWYRPHHVPTAGRSPKPLQEWARGSCQEGCPSTVRRAAAPHLNCPSAGQ